MNWKHSFHSHSVSVCVVWYSRLFKPCLFLNVILIWLLTNALGYSPKFDNCHTITQPMLTPIEKKSLILLSFSLFILFIWFKSNWKTFLNLLSIWPQLKKTSTTFMYYRNRHCLSHILNSVKVKVGLTHGLTIWRFFSNFVAKSRLCLGKTVMASSTVSCERKNAMECANSQLYWLSEVISLENNPVLVGIRSKTTSKCGEIPQI